MTFEEFKQQFEIFSETDTPEKLTSCEKKYLEYLSQKEYDDYFKPFDGASDDGDWLANYHRNLHSMLGFDKIANNQIFFLTQPSFAVEHLLVIEKLEGSYTLTLISVEESYWIKFRDNSISTAKTQVSSGQLSKSIGDQVFELVEQSIIDAKKPQSGGFVLDGTVYKLSKIIDGIRLNVTKHSPDGNSKTGRIIELLNTIAKLAKGNPSPTIENEIESIVKLIENSTGLRT